MEITLLKILLLYKVNNELRPTLCKTLRGVYKKFTTRFLASSRGNNKRTHEKLYKKTRYFTVSGSVLNEKKLWITG